MAKTVPICVFDTETTGIDTENDRIIQAFVGLMGPDGEWIRKREWVIDPGVEVPEGASDVHGFTTERLAAEGRKDVAEAIKEIYAEIYRNVASGAPLVAYNAPFDTTILDRELRRLGGGMYLELSDVVVIDPLVCDKARYKFRKGSRKLVDVAPHYGVPVEENAHDAGADCLMAGRIALKMIEGLKISLGELHRRQVAWKAEQSASLQEYFRSSKNKNGADPEAFVDPSWPIRPYKEQ